MNELIVIQPKQIGNEKINSVDARDLHSRLGVKKDFTSWIKGNINKLNLVEDVDYLLTQKGEQLPSGTKYISEYILTLDAGKHIAMMTNTETAHDIRRYFIEFEKAHKVIVPQLPTDPIMAQLSILQSVREQQLALESGLHVVATGISETRNDVNHLKQNMRIENWQQCNIKDAVHAKAAEFHDLYPASEYGDIIRKIWRFFKNKFSIPRYQELPAMMYEEGMKTIRNLAMHNLAGL